MNKRIIWILVSLLMAVTLIIASCDTKTEETTVEEDDEGKVVITETEVHLDEGKTEEEGVEVSSDGPQYGGTLTIPLTGDILYFTSLGYPMEGFTFHITNQMILDGDWSRGPAGTGEFTWYKGSYGDWNSVTGRLAESWDIPEVGTIIFNIRHGVHFYLVGLRNFCSSLGGNATRIIPTIGQQDDDPRFRFQVLQSLYAGG